jgi:hypothetical protein
MAASFPYNSWRLAWMQGKEVIMKKLLVLLAFIASSAHAEIYTWTDSRGVAHYTNKLDEVPDRYRNKVKALNYGPEQKSDTSAPQQTGQLHPVQPVEQAPPQKAGGNLSSQNAPVKPEDLRKKRNERRQQKTRSVGRGAGQEEE